MPGGVVALDLGDEIQAAVVVSHGGRLIQPRVRAALDSLEDQKEIRS